MTLTDMMPSLRRTLPDPLDVDRWPEASHATTTDVIVAGVAMTRLVELCGSPCVHTGAAVIPGTHGRPSPSDGATVVVLGVVEVRGSGLDRVVVVDGGLGNVPAVWSEARMIGRASCAHRHSARIRSAGGEEATADLPDDVRPDDLIAVPCSGMVVLRDLRARDAARSVDPAQPAWLSRLD